MVQSYSAIERRRRGVAAVSFQGIDVNKKKYAVDKLVHAEICVLKTLQCFRIRQRLLVPRRAKWCSIIWKTIIFWGLFHLSFYNNSREITGTGWGGGTGSGSQRIKAPVWHVQPGPATKLITTYQPVIPLVFKSLVSVLLHVLGGAMFFCPTSYAHNTY